MTEIPSSIDRRIKKSKAALKDALIQLMQKQSFKEISITDIVQLADLNGEPFTDTINTKKTCSMRSSMTLLRDWSSPIVSLIWIKKYLK